MTYPHHDSNGHTTYVSVVSGMKFWTLYFIKDARKKRRELGYIFNKLCDPTFDHSQLKDVLDVVTVPMYPTDAL